MRVAIYIRFGNKPEVLSLQEALEQRKLRTYAEQHGYDICEAVTEYVTAFEPRPILERLLAAPSDQFQAILSDKPSHFCRDFFELGVWKSKAASQGKRLIFADDNDLRNAISDKLYGFR